MWGDDLHRALDFDQAAGDGQALGSTLGTDPDRLAPFEQPDDYRVYFPGAETGDGHRLERALWESRRARSRRSPDPAGSGGHALCRLIPDRPGLPDPAGAARPTAR
ncbi:MAG: hypothetical protein MZV65_45575 [Chromatiales bacterium]|nr:hypothetical protein [Chromatiales bacterium]